MNRVFAPILSLSLSAACAAPTDDADARRAELTARTLDRVVVARMYQRAGWVVPGVDPEIDRGAAAQHVCDAIAPLRPTYVSGLVRLAHDDGITEEQADMFSRVRRCIERRVPHPVRFDVVLNALDYTDGTPEPDRCAPGPSRLSADELTARFRQRRRSIEEHLRPDGYFFDFFSQPWTREDRDGGPWRPQVLAEEIRRIQRDGMFVGGNVWAGFVPPPADFVAITDRSGREGVLEHTARLRAQGVPVLLHIRNDPHIEGSEGRLWNERDRAHRKRVLRRHVRWANAAGATYMFPVLFPLRPNPDATGSGCDRRRPWIAYDASRDGEMLERMRDYLDRGDRAARLLAAHGDDALPSALDAEDDGPVLVHRSLNGGAAQHLFSTSLLEIEDASALAMEVEGYFALGRTPGEGAAALHRCYVGYGEHLLTTASDCEGAPGASHEGVMGYVSTVPAAGMVALHRLYRPGDASYAPDHFYTTSAPERDAAAAYGYRSEGIAGYVWNASGLAVAGPPPPPPPPALTAIHRGVHRSTGQHLYSVSLGEILSAPGVVYESEVFHLARDPIAGTVPFHRCYLGNGWHLQTTHPACEGAAGAIDEGVIGHIAATALPGTVPLHRMFRGGTRPDHFYTIDGFARAYAASIGYRDEGIVGWVFP
jgi:hypothetical protein